MQKEIARRQNQAAGLDKSGSSPRYDVVATQPICLLH